MATNTNLPQGVLLHPLTMHTDGRGVLAEIFRDEWRICETPVQWNAVRSKENVLRGVHVHPTHSDYLAVIDGHMLLGLHDIRRDSPTRGMSALVDLRGEDMQTVFTPPGVVHGFFFPVPTTYVYAVTHYWDIDDELGCKWNAPELKLDWPARNPSLSPRDASAGSYSEMVEAFHAARATGARS
jgi:dTDP-4-dehydrorhamnose 3,5-epimerase